MKQFLAPAFMLAYIFYGDASGLTDEETAAYDTFYRAASSDKFTVVTLVLDEPKTLCVDDVLGEVCECYLLKYETV